MAKLKLTLACGDYDRTHALVDGSVQVEGIDLNYRRLYDPNAPSYGRSRAVRPQYSSRPSTLPQRNG